MGAGDFAAADRGQGRVSYNPYVYGGDVTNRPNCRRSRATNLQTRNYGFAEGPNSMQSLVVRRPARLADSEY
jgi:hypothetical protein